jgi:RNA polymerase sigma factor (sigma-70 family)
MSESVEIVTGGGNRSLEEAWTQAQAGLGYVAWLARDYLYTGVPREDLESEGRLGLLDAALRFDPAHGVQFITYASWWARRRMQLFAARHARVVRRPATRASARPIEWVRSRSTIPWGWGQRAAGATSSLIRRRAPLSRTCSTWKGSHSSRGAVGELPPLWARVVSLRFGFHDRAPMTLRAIGARLGLSRERVRQIERSR